MKGRNKGTIYFLCKKTIKLTRIVKIMSNSNILLKINKILQYRTLEVEVVKAAIILYSFWMMYDFGLGIPDMFEKISFFVLVLIMDYIVYAINDDNYYKP